MRDFILKFNSSIREILVSLVKFYQYIFSPFLGANKCRFNPTCSNYMIEAISKKGIIKGLWLGALRILKCNPFFSGGNDPVK